MYELTEAGRFFWLEYELDHGLGTRLPSEELTALQIAAIFDGVIEPGIHSRFVYSAMEKLVRKGLAIRLK